MRSMNLGMATVMSREQMLTSLQTNIKQAFQSMLNQNELPKVVEQAVASLADLHIETATAHIAKNAFDRAVPDVESESSF